MAIVFVVLGAVVVFAIAAAAVGVTTSRLAVEHPATVFSVEEAVVAVGDGLDDDAARRLSYGDVRRVVGWYVDFLDANDLTDADTYDAGSGLIVVAEDETLPYLQHRAATERTGVDDLIAAEDVAAVHAGLVAYLREIGAVGTEAEGPVDADGAQAEGPVDLDGTEAEGTDDADGTEAEGPVDPDGTPSDA